MDAEQDTRRNPYGMDEDCRNCPGLCDVRERVVHGYGDVGADFVFVGESPSAASEAAERGGLADVTTHETIQREFQFGERGSRPDTGPVGHTGFLTIARAPDTPDALDSVD